jgi:hypothetical protein
MRGYDIESPKAAQTPCSMLEPALSRRAFALGQARRNGRLGLTIAGVCAFVFAIVIVAGVLTHTEN